MHTYVIKVSAEINYWWEKEYRINATNVATAIARAMRDFKKEERIKGERIKRYKLDVADITAPKTAE